MKAQIIGCSIEGWASTKERYVIFLEITAEGAQSLLRIREELKSIMQTAPYLATHILPYKIKGLQAGYLEPYESAPFELFNAGQALNKTIVVDHEAWPEELDGATYDDDAFYLRFEGEKLKVVCTVFFNYEHEASEFFFDISLEQLQAIAAGESAQLD